MLHDQEENDSRTTEEKETRVMKDSKSGDLFKKVSICFYNSFRKVRLVKF